MVSTSTLASLISDAELLISLPPEEVGKQLLRVASANTQNGIFNRETVAGREALFGRGYPSEGRFYSENRSTEIQLAAYEAWQWLELSQLIMPASGPNASGWFQLTRRGSHLLESANDFDKYIEGARFPKALLHSSIAEEVWSLLAQNKLDVAVFSAFRMVEEKTRIAAGFEQSDHGVPMIRRAFHKDNGPLTNLSQPDAEREALANLFAGAIGSYKNPHSHRTVEIADPSEAHEMVILASHLLRIIDGRRNNKGAA